MAQAGGREPEIAIVEAAADGAPPRAAVLAVRMTPPAGGGPEAGAEPGADALALAAALDLDLAAALSTEKARGEPGEVVAVPLPAARAQRGAKAVRRVLLVGVGDGSPAALRKAGAALARRARDYESAATTLAAEADGDGVRAFVEGLLLGSYTFSMKSARAGAAGASTAGASRRPAPGGAALRRVSVVSSSGAEAATRGVAAARAVRLARDLVNTPSLEKTPDWLAAQAVTAGERAGLTVRVRDERALAAEGFGGILGVGGGSARPPRLIEMSYRPRNARGPHVVLVGKGITFDSGGLSLKPGPGMVSMKTDMAGGAAVIATMTALRDLGVGVRVTGLVPAAENMPSGTAIRPGDVLTHYDGTTVEVLNTDAEGRLVLADGLGYAAAKLAPDVLVDLATLTGAASQGLGRIHGALFATDEPLATSLLDAADAAGERLWRMPLVEDYRDSLDSDIADLRNIGDPKLKYSGGAISAALFLREFTRGLPWAHLDIAGPARSDKDEGETTRGGTGYGVRLLLRWLEADAS